MTKEAHLFYAAEQGNCQEMLRYLSEGADINYEEEGYTVLQKTVLLHYEEAVILLLKSPGIDVNKQNRDGWTALQIALLCAVPHSYTIIHLLRLYGAEIDHIFWEAFLGDTTSLHQDIIHIPDSNGCFSYHY